MKRILLVGITFFSVALHADAQDTTRKYEVNVTASFQPVLRDATKINFSATPPAVDTTRPTLQYNIPNQNLFFAYQPGSLKPLALSVDSILRWDNSNYVKAGYGSLRSPYLEAGLSIGDPSKAGVNIYGNYTAAKGKRAFQEASRGQVDALGYTKVGPNHQLTARIGFQDEQYYRYGYEPQTLVFPKDSLSAHYSTFRSRFGLRNLNATAYGISYAPEISIETFSDNRSNSESNSYFYLPLRKSLENRFEVEIAVDGNFTSYNPKGKTATNNKYFQVSPSLFVKTAAFYIQAGLRPSWDNGFFKLLPNILGEVGTPDKRIAVIGGWTGHLRSNSFQYLAGNNPWIDAPNGVANSRIEEIYGGIKGTVTDHFSYLVRGGLNQFTNTPLYKNTGTGGKSFAVVYEPKMRAVNIHGEATYTVGDRFNIRSTLDLNKYANLDVQKEAWGLPQLEFTTTMRLQVLRDLYVKADVYGFNGVKYEDSLGVSWQTNGLDVSAGLEFKVVKNIKIWAQFNNLFNQDYQRWHQYPVYGFQFLGGIVFSFPQIRK
jgi:hypothetical protein